MGVNFLCEPKLADSVRLTLLALHKLETPGLDLLP